jgi:hypothetical protein
MISVVSMSRRPVLYKQFVQSMEEQMGTLVLEYLVFVNDKSIYSDYKQLEREFPNKLRVISTEEDFVFKYGHDMVYNFLDKQAKGDYILKLFDTDRIEIDFPTLQKEIESQADIYGIPTYMQRGDVWETKYQLYKKGVLTWFGLVHENQHFNLGNQNLVHVILKGMKVYHENALDPESAKLEKKNGFIILQKTQEGSDSDSRNLLYETLTWKIVNENGRHDSRQWFVEHYQLNKEIIDDYAFRANKKYNLGLEISKTS